MSTTIRRAALLLTLAACSTPAPPAPPPPPPTPPPTLASEFDALVAALTAASADNPHAGRAIPLTGPVPLVLGKLSAQAADAASDAAMRDVTLNVANHRGGNATAELLAARVLAEQGGRYPLLEERALAIRFPVPPASVARARVGNKPVTIAFDDIPPTSVLDYFSKLDEATTLRRDLSGSCTVAVHDAPPTQVILQWWQMVSCDGIGFRESGGYVLVHTTSDG